MYDNDISMMFFFHVRDVARKNKFSKCWLTRAEDARFKISSSNLPSFSKSLQLFDIAVSLNISVVLAVKRLLRQAAEAKLSFRWVNFSRRGL